MARVSFNRGKTAIQFVSAAYFLGMTALCAYHGANTRAFCWFAGGLLSQVALELSLRGRSRQSESGVAQRVLTTAQSAAPADGTELGYKSE
jgi:hypothetical protein